MDLMAALSGWLQQIVAVVLLAGLVDLLLPNRTMQRYVRLVAGLIVLLTVSGPMLQWIRGDVNSRLADGLKAVEFNPAAAVGELARIEEEGRQWRQRSQQQSVTLAATQLENAIRADIEQIGGREPAAVKVDLRQASDGSIAVQGVVITLLEQTNAVMADAGDTSAAPPDKTRAIEPIEPVMPVVIGAVSQTPPRSMDTRAAAGTDSADRQRITAFLSVKYGIPESRIHISQAAANADQGG